MLEGVAMPASAAATRPASVPPPNTLIAAMLDEVATRLEAQGANPFRVRAYHTAAGTLRALAEPAAGILARDGAAGLMALPGIGRSLAHAIEQVATSGRMPLLERLRGDDAAERTFATVANIGPGLARRIHETLAIETLSELMAAADDGRLAQVPGMGDKRIRSVRESLAGRFRPRTWGERVAAPDRAMTTSVREKAPALGSEEPPVAELLDIDAEYRELERHGRLPRIAPRRFNPTREAWLPVLHTERQGRHYTALYSNTARAHELGATHDWVVIYLDDHDGHGRWTVITSAFGALRGRRIVRGRESECAVHYDAAATRAAGE
jgi:hypothetical protein